MRFRTTILLILILLGLGAYVYWVEYPKAQEEAKKKTLFDVKADDVQEVSLIYVDREIVLKKTGDDWRITKPMDVAADTTAAKNLVSAIAECEVKKELTDTSADLSQYGLDKPFVTLKVRLKDKELPPIAVGKNTPVGFSTYLQKGDDKKVVLTSSAFRSGVDKQVKDLRDKTILAVEDQDVHKIVIHSDDKDITLAEKDTTWSIENPGPYPADATVVHQLLTTMRSMRAVNFPDDNPTDLSTYGLDHPRLTVTVIAGKDNAEKRVLLGKEKDKNELYVQTNVRPTVYTVSDWVFRDLNKSVGDFRDKTLLAFDRDKITAVTVKRKDGAQFKLVRGEDKQWKVEGSDGKSSEQAISQFLSDLHDLKGYEIAADHPTDLSQFALDQPTLTLTVLAEDNKVVGSVLIGQSTGQAEKKEYAAMSAGGSTVFLVRDYLVTRLNKQAQDFVEKPTPTAVTGTPNPQTGAPAAEELEEGPAEENEPADEQ